MDELDTIPSVLACDVGNTNVRLAGICGEDVDDIRVVPAGDANALAKAVADLWDELAEPRCVVAASVPGVSPKRAVPEKVKARMIVRV